MPKQAHLSAKSVAAHLDIGLSTVWDWHHKGILPPAIKIGPNCTRWRLSDIEAWIESKKGKEAKA